MLDVGFDVPSFNPGVVVAPEEPNAFMRLVPLGLLFVQFIRWVCDLRILIN